jgi:hypothetical protein
VIKQLQKKDVKEDKEEIKNRRPIFYDGQQLSFLDRDLLKAYAQSKLEFDKTRLLITLETMVFINQAYIEGVEVFVNTLRKLKRRHSKIVNGVVDKNFDDDLFDFESELLKFITPIISPYIDKVDDDETLYERMAKESDL